MRLSCCAYSYRQALQNGSLSLPNFLRLCREIGFDGVELTSYYFPTTERTYLNSIKLLAHREGLAVSGTAVRSDFTQPDAERRRADIESVKEWIAHSVVLGAPTMRVFAGAVRAGQTEAEAFQNVVDCLAECAEHAAANGVLLALENHGGVTATAEGTLAILRAVNHPALGLNLDFGNFSEDIYTQFAACAPFAVATHAKPVAHHPDPARSQTVDYTQVRAILEEAGYRGFLAMEYEEKEPAETGVPRFFQQLHSVFKATA